LNDFAKNLVLWVIIALVLMMVFRNFGAPAANTNVPYSQFIANVKTGRVDSVTIEGNTILGELSDGSRFTSYSPETSNEALIGTLLDNNVEILGSAPRNSFWAQALISWFPILLLLGIWIYFMRQMQGGGGGRGALSFGKSRARLLGEDQVRVTFNDVAGVEEAKEEVSELVEFLRDPVRRTHGWFTWDWQDLTGKGNCRRGQGAVFYYLWF
jgi:cell division protease FtsH